MPMIVLVMIVAKHMGVPPWELIAQPAYWFYWGLCWMNAEGYAEREQMDELKKKSKRRVH